MDRFRRHADHFFEFRAARDASAGYALEDENVFRVSDLRVTADFSGFEDDSLSR